ncbi:MAG: multiubiquitin domain-containing protein [Phycisphaerales bacterium]
MSEATKTRKELTIIVNGREKVVDSGELCYDELLALAFDPVPTGEFICFSITYRRGHGNKPEGTLDEGECVRVKKGMIFNVSFTDKS